MGDYKIRIFHRNTHFGESATQLRMVLNFVWLLVTIGGHSYLYLGELINDFGALPMFVIFCVEYCDIDPSLCLHKLKYTL